MSKISVIVPVYKVEQYLGRCIDSILEQTFKDFELILIDDGSPDNCGKICDEYALKDDRIHVIHQNNRGLSAARNAGIDWVFTNSNSEWISFIDSDDWINSAYLEKLYNAIKETNIKISICRYKKIDQAYRNIDEEVKKGNIQICKTDQFYIENNMNATVAWGKLYYKQFFKKLRYPVGRIHEDEFLTYKILFQSNEVAVIEEELYYYYQRPDSIMNTSWSLKRLDALDAYKERIQYFDKMQKKALRQWTLEKYIWYICSLFDKVQTFSDPELTKQCNILLKKRLKESLIKYYKDLSLEKMAGAYEKAFPHFMKWYWLGYAFINKLKKYKGKINSI